MPVAPLLVAVLLGAMVPGGTAARAGTAGPCPTLADGVTVVVDHGSLGGGAEVRCAPGEPASGLAALQGAGFSYGFVPGKPGFVCTIDGGPDPCNGAPTSAYWAYHHAPRGGGWTYATIGAGTRRPPVGSVEGWAFGDGDAPALASPAAPAVIAPTPPPPPAPAPAPAPIPGPSPDPALQPAATPSPSPQPGSSTSPTTVRAGTPSTLLGTAAPTTSESVAASTTTTATAEDAAAPPTTGLVASPAMLAESSGAAEDGEPATLPPLAILGVLAAVGALGAGLARRRANVGDGPTS